MPELMADTLAKAIAFSAGNKAQTQLPDGSTLVVQARYQGIGQLITHNWLHIWHITGDEVWESDMRTDVDKGAKLQNIYDGRLNAKIWQSI